MVKLEKSLGAWNSKGFEQVIKAEIEALRQDVLPLREVVGAGNRVYDNDLGVALLDAVEEEGTIQARIGVFFAEVITCVSCGEGDPIDEAYCEMRVSIDKASAEAQFSVIAS